MADVARLAGVSQKTVSRVVNDAPNVSDSVRQRVNEAILQLGFRPNAAARALASQRSRVIGIVTPDCALYGPTEQLIGLERSAREAGYAVEIVSATTGAADEVLAATARLLDHGVDGIALAAPFGHLELPERPFRDVPYVVVGDPVPGRADVLAVACDQRAGAAAAVEHLLSLGHETVWHVSGPLSWESARARQEAWARTLEAAGAPVPAPVEGDWSPRSGYEAGRSLAERPEVTAVFAANDHMAVGIMRAFWEKGRRIPSDVSLVGFDDVPEAEFLVSPLTTVRQDFARVTRRAITELVHAMSGIEVIRETVLLPVELITRASSGPAPQGTPGTRHRA